MSRRRALVYYDRTHWLLPYDVFLYVQYSVSTLYIQKRVRSNEL